MDVNLKGVESDANGKILNSLECPKGDLNGVECHGDDETQLLLPSKKGEKPRRKVQWLDRNGSKLAEIFVFQPSDTSDSDEEEFDTCICRIM